MAFGGRGRGGGWGGGRGGGYARPQKFELFPELQDNALPKASSVKQEIDLMIWSYKLQSFWKSSAYYLEDKGIKKEENTDIERYSDMGKKRKLQKDKLSDFMKCTVDYVPAELALDSQYGRKKVRWNQDAGLTKLDFFEKLEQKGGGKGKEDEDEEEEEVVDEEDADEYSDDGDYEQNIDFDDDEDDFNTPEDNNDDEGYY